MLNLSCCESYHGKKVDCLNTAHKNLGTMRRIELDVQEDISKTVIDMLKLCNGVEVVSMGDVEMATEEQVAACVAQAIAELRADKIAFRSYDFT